MPYVRDAIVRGEPVHVALEAPEASALATALGRDADQVAWGDPERATRTPGRRLRRLASLLDEHDRRGAGRIRLVSSHARPLGPAGAEVEWARLDAAITELVAGSRVEVVCTYDAAALPASVVEHAARAHPSLGLPSTGPSPSPCFEPPAVFAGSLRPGPLIAPPGAARLAPAHPATARAYLRGLLVASGLGDERIDEALVSASELVTNAWKAGAANVALASWPIEAGVAVQVDDDGPGLEDPFAGYRRPALDAPGGRGLWIVRQLCDLVEIAASSGGTSVRVQVLGPTGAATGARRGPA